MDDGSLQEFVNEFPRAMFNACEGKYTVSLDVVSGINSKKVPVLCIFTDKNPVLFDTVTLFFECKSHYSGNMKNYANYLASIVKERESFFTKHVAKC